MHESAHAARDGDDTADLANEDGDSAVYAAALAGLPGMTPIRLARLLDGFEPSMAWHALAAGAHPGDFERRFESAARATDVTSVADAYAQAGVSVLVRDRVGYPARLVGDGGQPAVLFARGDVSCVDRRSSAAIVGTRSATHYGRSMAAEIAGDLSAAGVVVVSGLAKGIDGAAHTAVVRRHDRVAEPVAVVGTGLDVPYPRSQSVLWTAVSEHGAVVSEQPLGTLPRPGVFPARNRIIAALSDVVVLIECHRKGGSLYTAEAAARRGIAVGAVPGSVRSPASSGCNGLIADGCCVVRDATDILTAIELVRAGPVAQRPDWRGVESVGHEPPFRRARDRPGPSPASDEQRRVLDAMDDHPTGLETILLRTGLPIATVAVVCEQLVERHCIVAGSGWWART